MTGFDYAVIVVVGLSTLLSVWRGAVQQLFSLAGWLLAFTVANRFAPVVEAWVPLSAGGETTRYLVAVIGVFVSTLLLTLLAGRLLAGALRGLGLGVADRLLGVLFGFLRGVLLVLLAVALAGMTPLPQTLMWREAASSAWWVAAVEWARPSLPQAFASRIRYD
ncbi:MAG: CvpA family protein [Burkholderiales bacterium]|nr:CvpA family protein [Betaproteobacteria bacterium]